MQFVSRAGLKLDHALREFGVDVNGLACADFGCNIGGFTDCLLQRGAAKVYAVDTGYGTFHWKLRNDPRVQVMERTNVLHCEAPQTVDLVVIDLAWTPQRHSMPAALRWLHQAGKIISLVKPHYEVQGEEKNWLVNGALSPPDADRVLQRVLSEFSAMGVHVLAHIASPITGGKSSRHGRGNIEYLVLLQPLGIAPASGNRPLIRLE